jgi:hypothetical protein
MKKLYKVKVEDIVYVMADSEEEAIDTALEEGTSSVCVGKYEAIEATRENFDESTGWTMNYIPCGEEERSIDEIFNEG